MLWASGPCVCCRHERTVCCSCAMRQCLKPACNAGEMPRSGHSREVKAG
jgi:hypothetical protein